MMKTTASLMFAFLAAGCAATVDVEAERAALLDTDRAWAAVASAGGTLDEILSFWAQDAVVMPPDAPTLRGHAEIRAYIEEAASLPGFSVSWEPQGADVAASGDLGYTYGRNEFTFESPEGELVRVTGRYLTTWRKQPDGSWKCTLEASNNDPPPTSE